MAKNDAILGKWQALTSGFHFEILKVETDGALSGNIYLTGDDTQEFKISGRVDEASMTWGFVASWNGWNSTTSYILSPMYDVCPGVMKCYWLKRDMHTGDIEGWNDTTLGMNIFRHETAKLEQHKNDVLKHSEHGGHSFPTSPKKK